MPRKCVIEGCDKKGYYNFLEIAKLTKKYYCGVHREAGMINCINKKCKSPNCIKIPTFNFEGLKPEYCKEHKEETMIATETKQKCKYEMCKKRANYKNQGETKPIYCNEHKTQDMITHTKRKPCEFDNCENRAKYNFNGLKPKFCKEHKEENMISVGRAICKFEGCNIQGTYNFRGLTRSFCFAHKLLGMVDVKNTCCEYEDCDKQPSYNFEDCNTIKFCHKHRLDGMIDIRNRNNKCLSELCPIIIKTNSRYKGYCLRCFIHLFPDEPVVRNYKTKETAVVHYIFSEFSRETYSWVSDRVIQDGCSRKRPDLLLDLGYQVIIVEVDEEQHKRTSYDVSCENKRLMQLSQDLDHRPIIIIRFNPDNYTSNGKTITSCWKINSMGICTIKKSKKFEWQSRLATLKSQIEYWIHPDNRTEKTIEIVQLYFDD